MYYKSKNIDFLTEDLKVSNLCVYNDCYYFESAEEINQAEVVSETEFVKAVDSIVHSEIEQKEPELTQNDCIEATVEYLAAMQE